MTLADIGSQVAFATPYTLAVASVISLVIVALNGWKFSKVTLYLLFCCLFESAGLYIGHTYGYNLFMMPLFYCCDYFFWSRFFARYTKDIKKYLKWFDILVVVYLLIELNNFYMGRGYLIIPAGSLFCLCTLVILMMSYLYDLKFDSTSSWVFYSVLFVLVTFNCFFFLVVSFSIYWSEEYKFYLWIFRSSALHLFYLFLPIYQWKNARTPQLYLFG